MDEFNDNTISETFITYDAFGYGLWQSPVIVQKISDNYFRLDSIDNLEFFIEFELPENWK